MNSVASNNSSNSTSGSNSNNNNQINNSFSNNNNNNNSSSNTPININTGGGTTPIIGLNRKQSSGSKTFKSKNNTIFSPPTRSVSTFLDHINKLQLESLEYVDLSAPTNIYGLSSSPLIQFESHNTASNHIHHHQPQLPLISDNHSKQNQLFIASRSNLVSVQSNENNDTGSLSWLSNEILSNFELNNEHSVNSGSSSPSGNSPNLTSTQQQQQQQQQQQSSSSSINNTGNNRNPSSPSKTPNNPPQPQNAKALENQIVSIASIVDDHLDTVIAATIITPLLQQQPLPQPLPQPSQQQSQSSSSSSQQSQQTQSIKGYIAFFINSYLINDDNNNNNNSNNISTNTTNNNSNNNSSSNNSSSNNNKNSGNSANNRKSIGGLTNSLQDFQLFSKLYIEYIPFHLTTSTIELENGVKKKVFILAGSDEKIHMYYYSEERNEFIESNEISKYFPEMSNLGSCALKIEIKYFKQFRIVAIGCQTGLLKLSITDELTKESRYESFFLDGPVQALCIFNENSDLDINSNITNNNLDNNNNNNNNNNSNSNNDNSDSIFSLINNNLNSMVNNNNSVDEEKEKSKIHLLVGSIIGYSVVYRDIFNYLLQDALLLENSDSFDSVTCVHVFDIDADGENELLIGTYGMELLVYKKQPDDQQQQQQQHSDITQFSNISGSGRSVYYKLDSYRHFSHPILGIQTIQLMSDGIKQIIFTTMFGVYIMRVPVSRYQEQILSKLDLLKEIIKLEKERNPTLTSTNNSDNNSNNNNSKNNDNNNNNNNNDNSINQTKNKNKKNKNKNKSN